jgi:hypothetical protein
MKQTLATQLNYRVIEASTLEEARETDVLRVDA